MKNTVLKTNEEIKNAVLYVLQYYSIFHYPLKADEIYGNSPDACSLSSILVALEELEQEERISMYSGYYSLSADIKELVDRRKAGNEFAHGIERKVNNVARFIYKFPFVRFVGISGSLSKGYADANSDYDFFIVTEKNRLWICRTLLHLFKKLTFLVGQQHKFCMNYFIDTHQQEIEEKNRFTAIEIASLIPVAGRHTYAEFMKENGWIDIFLPNGYVRFCSTPGITNDTSFLKRVGESMFNRLLPERLNKWLMRLTDRKWRKKWAKKGYPMNDYDLAFKTTLHVSKNHAANHQKRILNHLSKLFIHK